MQSIPSVDAVFVGDTLHHPAFGFATVEAVDEGGAALRWELQGANHPVHASPAALGSSYRRCDPRGIFAESVREPAAARMRVQIDPLTAIALLVWELDGPMRREDIRDWLAARRLFPAERFDVWWDALQPLLRDDARFAVRNDTIALVEGQGADDLLARRVAMLPAPGTLPPAAAFGLGLDMARRLASVHAAGLGVVPDRQKIEIDGNEVRFHTRGAPTAEGRRGDVLWAARTLLEQVIGPLPPHERVPTSTLTPLIAVKAPELPPELVAVLAEALADDPWLRPADGLALLERLHTAESVRSLRAAVGWAREAHAVASYDTHIGAMKALAGQTNQDAFLLLGDPTLSLLCVFDGISQCTVGSGDLASGLCAGALRQHWGERLGALRPANSDALHGFLRDGLRRANEAVCDAAARLAGAELESCIPMGSTALCALTRGNRVHLAALGDSRAYVVGRHGAALLTYDQNVLADRVKTKRGDARPDRSWNGDWTSHGNALVGFCGHFDEALQPALPPLFTRTLELLPGEWLILCSDGFTDYAAGEEAAVCRLLSEIVEEARRAHPGANPSSVAMEICPRLVLAANRGGGGDNVTVLALTLSSEYGPLTDVR